MESEAAEYLKHYTRLWELIPDGESFFTHSSLLQPVQFKGTRAMIKIPMQEEEKTGALLMLWWNGRGAAKVLKYEEHALLLERAADPDLYSLADMAMTGRDDEASRILCRVACRLHSVEGVPLPSLIPLSEWFKELWPASDQFGGILKETALMAAELIKTSQEKEVLHGDIHHGNVLFAGQSGWIAIDPKGLIGERGFDYANILCNPDPKTALRPGRLSAQIKIISEESGLDARRLLQWTIAWTGLSASWLLREGKNAEPLLKLAENAFWLLRS